MKIETRTKVIWVLSLLLLGLAIFLVIQGGCQAWVLAYHIVTLILEEILEHGTGCCIRQCCDSPGCCAELFSRVLVNPILVGWPAATLLILISFSSISGECAPVGMRPIIWVAVILYVDSLFRCISVCIRGDIYNRKPVIQQQTTVVQNPQFNQAVQQQSRQDRPPSMLLAPVVGQPHQLQPHSPNQPHNPYYGQPQARPMDPRFMQQQQQPPQPAGYPPGSGPYPGFGGPSAPSHLLAQPAPPPDEGKPAPMAFGGGLSGHSPQQVSVEIDVEAVIANQKRTDPGLMDIDLNEEESISISLAGPDEGGAKRSIVSAASGGGLSSLGRVVSAKDVIDGDFVLNEKVTAGGPGETEEISWNSDFEGFARRASTGFIDALRAIDPEMQCVMCLCELEPGEVIAQLNCGHFYHKECIVEWFEDENHLCPYCRGDVRNFRKARWADS